MVAALHLWASIERNGHPSVGYYHQQPWYLQSGYREAAVRPSEADFQAASRVAGIVTLMAQRGDHARSSALTVYYGAFPGALDMTKNQRQRMWLHENDRYTLRDFYRLKTEAERLIEGAIVYG